MLKSSAGAGQRAPTGVAAELVGGTTIHALCGIGVPRTVADFNKMLLPDAKERLTANCDVLVIDEVSMLSGELLDRLDELLRRLKRRAGEPARPFGGIQLVLLGDFHQLPPIEEAREGQQCPHLFLNRGFAFQSAAWLRSDLQCFALTQIFRQGQEESRFIAALDRVRHGTLDADTVSLLNSTVGRPPRVRQAEASDAAGEAGKASEAGELAIEPTKLFCRNVDVDRRNAQSLAQLDGKSWWGLAEDWVEVDKVALAPRGRFALAQAEKGLKERGSLWRSCRVGLKNEIKVGAQVMMVVNRDLTPEKPERMVVNGSRGVVVGWAEKDACDKLRRTLLREANVYEKLSESMPSNSAEQVDAAHNAQERRRRAAWIVRHGNALPVVRFANGRCEAIGPHTFSSVLPGTGRCCRIQLPLRLAWW